MSMLTYSYFTLSSDEPLALTYDNGGGGSVNIFGFEGLIRTFLQTRNAMRIRIGQGHVRRASPPPPPIIIFADEERSSWSISRAAETGPLWSLVVCIVGCKTGRRFTNPCFLMYSAPRTPSPHASGMGGSHSTVPHGACSSCFLLRPLPSLSACS